VLPPHAGDQLIGARERAFFVAKAAGVNDIVDVVVPRAAIPSYLARAGVLASDHASLVTGCGHAGDGNVHLSVFQPDPEIRRKLVHALLQAGIEAGGAISGEHGLGRAKAGFFLELGDPVVIGLMERLKQAFDPNGILGPGNLPKLPGPDRLPRADGLSEVEKLPDMSEHPVAAS
jgi:glycolate oxidase